MAVILTENNLNTLTQYPKISIITPSYNQGEYLEETIKSVVEQGYPNLEYIIIDGGSTDNSVEIIKKYEEHISYWVSEKDEGLYDGIQKGFEKSTGDIMAWINSDDMYHKKSLHTIADIFTSLPKINWIMGKNTFYDEEGKMFVSDLDSYKEHWSKWRLYLGGAKPEFIQQESVFWRRSLWEKAGGYIDKSLLLAGDAELWLRFFRFDHLYSTTFLLSGFRYRSKNQKSLDNLDQYIVELNNLISRELNFGNNKAYLFIVRIMKFLSSFVLIRKYRKKLIYKMFKFSPKLMYNSLDGYCFHKYYKQ